jgi:hypothetical protein
MKYKDKNVCTAKFVPVKVDCVWGDWEDTGTCSAQCGGGTKT